MDVQDRNYRVEHYRAGEESAFETHWLWLGKPSARYFESLARLHLAGFWRRDGNRLRPVSSAMPIADLVIVRDRQGQEMCRWSVADELANLRKLPASVPAFIAELVASPSIQHSLPT